MIKSKQFIEGPMKRSDEKGQVTGLRADSHVHLDVDEREKDAKLYAEILQECEDAKLRYEIETTNVNGEEGIKSISEVIENFNFLKRSLTQVNGTKNPYESVTDPLDTLINLLD